jgi:hypothetical protein
MRESASPFYYDPARYFDIKWLIDSLPAPKARTASAIAAQGQMEINPGGRDRLDDRSHSECDERRRPRS